MHVKHKSLIFLVEKMYRVKNYIFKIDIKDTRTRSELSSKLTMKTPEGFFPLLTLNMHLFAG